MEMIKAYKLVDLKMFEKQEKIGSGGYSKVYKVCEKKTGKIFSAKVLLNELDESRKEELKDFINEVTNLSICEHPLFLKLIGISKTNFKNEPKPVIITEFCSKGSLNKIIQNSPDILDDTKKLIFIYGIASAMSFMHSKNILHRDLKPENILSDENYYPKISDFGLSIQIPKDSIGMSFKESIICGTPIYIAPEIWRNNEYSKASDVYAFGMIAYEIMTCQKPFKEFQSYVQIVYNVVRKLYRPKIDKSIPESYQKLIEACWNEDPQKRPTFSIITSIIEKDFGFITEKTDQINFSSFSQKICHFENDLKIMEIDRQLKYEINIENLRYVLSHSDIMYRHLDEIRVKLLELEQEMLKGQKNGNLDEIGMKQLQKIRIIKAQIDIKRIKLLEIIRTITLNKSRRELEEGRRTELLEEISRIGLIEESIRMELLEEISRIGLIEESIRMELLEEIRRIELSEESRMKLLEKIRIMEQLEETRRMKQLEETRMKLLEEIRRIELLEKSRKYEYKMHGSKSGRMNSFSSWFGRLFTKNPKKEFPDKPGKKSNDDQSKIMPDPKLIDEARNGSIKAMLQLGEQYYKGKNAPVDKEKSKEYYKMAADRGNADAMNNYAWILIEEKENQSNIDEAMSYLERAANMGNVTAMRNYLQLIDELENKNM